MRLADNPEAVDITPPATPADTPPHEETTAGARFRNYRRSRPFWAAVFLILSSILLLIPSISLNVGEIVVAISTISGVSTVLLATIMFLCGLACLLYGRAHIFAGIIALVVALLTLPTSNLGGLVIGSLFGIIGGALAVAWTSTARPTRRERKANDDALAATAEAESAAPTVEAAETVEKE